MPTTVGISFFKSSPEEGLSYKEKKLQNNYVSKLQAGDERIELPPKVLETPIIPFDQSPIYT